MKWVPKVWGGENIWASNDLYCGKILEVKRGHFSSFHRHKKVEDWLIYEGKILLIHSQYKYFKQDKDCEFITFAGPKLNGLTIDEGKYSKEVILEKGCTYHIPSLEWNILYAMEDSKIFEVSTKDEESERLTESK